MTIIQGKGTLPRERAGRNIHYDDSSLANYKKVEQGDFIIHLRSFEGGLEMANEDGIVSPAYTILRCKKPHSSLFYEAYFHTDEFINHILSKSVEGIRDGRQISYEAFKWLGLPYCDVSEQEKIAQLFCTLSRRIEKQQQMVDALKKYKRGVIQQVFTGRKGTRKACYPEWQQSSLGEYFTEQTIRTSNTPSTPLVSLTVEDGITPKTERYYREFLVTKEGENYKMIKPGWFAYNPMNAHLGAIAPNHLGYTAAVSGYYNIFSVNEPDTICFWEEYLTSYSMLIHYKLIATGSLIEKQRVHYSQFVRIRRCLPSVGEQKHLSKLFETLNKKIANAESTERQLVGMRVSLLQQLFI
ncbi:restriction endonuclease subunit S [Clostridiaceae bacterium Marseille-Q4145]|nr:restriction endonuclease subunit S [Clostridiaceae bacterium Marseille-Q4145]